MSKFTVKHITLSGVEQIYAADHVTYEPAEVRRSRRASEPHTPQPGHPHEAAVIAYEASEEHFLQGGTVFVMNEFGRTISRYDLGASEIPDHDGIDARRTARITRLAAVGEPAEVFRA